MSFLCAFQQECINAHLKDIYVLHVIVLELLTPVSSQGFPIDQIPDYSNKEPEVLSEPGPDCGSIGDGSAMLAAPECSDIALAYGCRRGSR